VLELEILGDDTEMPAEPGFVAVGGLADVHGGSL
jgi:hypothetical protein